MYCLGVMQLRGKKKMCKKEKGKRRTKRPRGKGTTKVQDAGEGEGATMGAVQEKRKRTNVHAKGEWESATDD
jgi:hypothetical protein